MATELLSTMAAKTVASKPPDKAVAKSTHLRATRSGASKGPVEKPAKSTPKPVKKSKAAHKSALAPERIKAILDLLAAAYPRAECALVHKDAWQLLVATILSAQCTDARVNMVTPVLFKRFPTPKDLAVASQEEIEGIIRTTGFFRNKAKSIKGAANKILSDFNGKVPREMSELLTVPGAARKTANVVLGVAYGIAVGVVVDTHVLRLSRRLELTTETTPEKVEQDLMKIIPQDHWIAFSHEMIHHGRQVCIARKPRCADCTLEKVCNSSDKTWSTH
jgi:endonuclease-3